MRFIHFVSIIGAILTFASSASAVSIGDNDTLSAIDLAPFTRIVEDKSDNFTPFTTQIENEFSTAPAHSTSIGYTHSTWWAEVSLENPYNKKETRFLEFADSGEGMPEITFFIKDSRQTISSMQSGGMHRPAQGTIDHRFIVLPITFEPNENISVQVRVKGDAINIPLHMHNENSFLRSNYHEMTWIGFSYGMLILMLLYNLAVFFASRDRSYLYYVGFILFLGFALTAFDGISAQYILRDTPYLNTHIINISASICALFLLLFTNEFLNIPQHRPLLARVIRGSALFCGLTALANLGTKLNLGTNLAVSIGTFVCLGSAASMYSVKRRLAISYLIPIIFFLIGNLLTTARLAAILPANFWTLNSLRIGMILNALFWSVALSYRIRTLLKEKFESEKMLLQKIKQSEGREGEALSNQMAIIQSVSAKLNVPLSTLIATINNLRANATTIQQQIYPQENTEPTLGAFLKEWRKHQQVLSTAMDRLKSLSGSLSEFKQKLLDMDIQRKGNKP